MIFCAFAMNLSIHEFKFMYKGICKYLIINAFGKM